MAIRSAPGAEFIPPVQPEDRDGQHSGPPHPSSEQDSQPRQRPASPEATRVQAHAGNLMTLIRRLGAVTLLAAVIAVWFGMAPEVPNHASQIARIEATDDSNNARTAGAPQQAVVNGWTTIEYLQLLAQQSDELASASVRDDRPGAMLGLCVAGIALLALTSGTAAPARPDHDHQSEPAHAPAAASSGVVERS